MYGLYDYTIPPGFGDTFFMYAFNGDSLTAGQDFFQQGIPINDGDFIARFWAGQETINQGAIQIYDKWTRGWFGPPGVDFSSFSTGAVVLPQHQYPSNGSIRFDVINAQPTVAGVDGALTVYKSQLVFAGVRRRPNYTSDPGPSSYPYYEKVFGYPFTLAINNYASTGGVLNPPVQNLIPIQDYDFELHRVECEYSSTSGGRAPVNATNFKITLYDNQWNPTSNVPILASRFFHFNNAVSAGQQNFFPSPPILYKIGSNIRFDIWSLLFSPTTLPVTFGLYFYGVRRIPCR